MQDRIGTRKFFCRHVPAASFSSPSSTISASAKKIFGQNKAPPSSSRAPAVSRYPSQRMKKGGDDRGSFGEGVGGGGEDVGTKLWLYRKERWQSQPTR